MIFLEARGIPFLPIRVCSVPLAAGPDADASDHPLTLAECKAEGITMFIEASWLNIVRRGLWRRRRQHLHRVIVLVYDNGREPIVIPMHRRLRVNALAPSRGLAAIYLVDSTDGWRRVRLPRPS